MGKIVEYIVVNSDLGMSPGKVAAQVAHLQTIIDREYYENPFSQAVNPVGRDEIEEFMIAVAKDYKDWVEGEQTKIILSGTQSQLEVLVEQNGAYSIRDNGHTEVPPNSLTVVGFSPIDKDYIKSAVGKLRLY